METKLFIPFVAVVEAHTYLLKQFWGMASTQARGALTPAQSEALETMRASMRAMLNDNNTAAGQPWPVRI